MHTCTAHTFSNTLTHVFYYKWVVYAKEVIAVINVCYLFLVHLLFICCYTSYQFFLSQVYSTATSCIIPYNGFTQSSTDPRHQGVMISKIFILIPGIFLSILLKFSVVLSAECCGTVSNFDFLGLTTSFVKGVQCFSKHCSFQPQEECLWKGEGALM
jgi:hypothetical protein